MHSRMRAAVAGTAAILALGVCGTASAATTHGDLLKLVGKAHRANANQSNNWFGYMQGTLEQGTKLFNSISGDWIVPTATQHAAGTDEASSDWIGIGGGCLDANCTPGLQDETLIQTGTEQDVDANGNTTYDAWWEVIPGPELIITGFTVAPGDQMHADISEVAPNSDLWNVTLQNVTRNETFKQTVPYTSMHGSAEWIEETPLTFGTNGAGLAALPNLNTIPFSNARVNGANAGLKSSEIMQLVDSNNHVIGTASAPNATADGFNVCAWATSCAIQ